MNARVCNTVAFFYDTIQHKLKYLPVRQDGVDRIDRTPFYLHNFSYSPKNYPSFLGVSKEENKYQAAKMVV